MCLKNKIKDILSGPWEEPGRHEEKMNKEVTLTQVVDLRIDTKES